MSIFDLIFGSGKRYPHVIIYAQTIERIPASSFSRSIAVSMDGQKQVIQGQAVKDMLRRLVQGGSSLNRLEEKLKASGLGGDQWERRKWLMGIVEAAASPAVQPEAGDPPADN